MKLPTKLATCLLMLLSFSFSSAANAAFPQDFSDVVFIEAPFVKGWPETSQLDVSIGGGLINMPYDKRTVWPPVRPNSLGGAEVNANAWGFIKLNGVWHAGTWEYLRPGQFVKKTKAYGGCCHFRPPINNFNTVNGEIYGFMIAGVTRDTSGGINVEERTNVVLYRWGVGVVAFEPEAAASATVTPVLDILLSN